MLGNDAMEFLKTLHNLDEIWKEHGDAEYNERQLTQFAERYHEHKSAIPIVVTQWVAVSDSLPEDTTEVLIYNSGEGWIDKGMLSVNGKWYDGECECIVTHWCPLPHPPCG